LPTLIFLLGALGFASYDDIVKTVSTAVITEVKKDYQEDFNLEKEIRLLRDSSRALTDEIKTLHHLAQKQTAGADSLLKSARLKANDALAVFMQFLPKGTIIPYFGTRYNFDNATWALCDGSKGTPNLRDRFVLGSSFENIGDQGGERVHKHDAQIDADGVVIKRNEKEVTRFNGPPTGVSFKTETHEHIFNMTRQRATVSGENHLPPYYRLVYLMKIK
jgi:hypothetical protein